VEVISTLTVDLGDFLKSAGLRWHVEALTLASCTASVLHIWGLDYTPIMRVLSLIVECTEERVKSEWKDNHRKCVLEEQHLKLYIKGMSIYARMLRVVISM